VTEREEPVMGVDIPQPFETVVDPVTIAGLPAITVSSVGPVGPVTVDGIPDTFHINIDTLPLISIAVEKIPKIQMGIDPVDLSISVKELPQIRGHLPADFSVGLSLLGTELLSVHLCGEAQIITEPFEPNPCEICGSPRRVPHHDLATRGGS
jgi:hypothetical protein